MKALEDRVTQVEESYLSEAEIKNVIHAEVRILNDTLVEIRDTLREMASDIAPWKNRQQMWLAVLMLADGWKSLALWAAATIGLILSTIGLLEVIGKF